MKKLYDLLLKLYVYMKLFYKYCNFDDYGSSSRIQTEKKVKELLEC